MLVVGSGVGFVSSGWVLVGRCSSDRFWGALRGRPGLLFAAASDPAMSDGPCRLLFLEILLDGILREEGNDQEIQCCREFQCFI